MSVYFVSGPVGCGTVMKGQEVGEAGACAPQDTPARIYHRMFH